MMKKIWLFFFLLVSVLFIHRGAYAAETVKIELTPTPCKFGACPSDLLKVYRDRGEACVSDFASFQANPAGNHFWIEDPEITAQGKADERARQFIYWALNKNSIQNNIPPVLGQIWGTTRNIAYVFTVLVAAILGIGIIVGQRANFDLKLKVGPSLMKVGGAILYITFSAALVFFMIQLSEIMMKFFIENLGGRDLFNIYFGSVSNAANYRNFVGCRDINIRVQESVQTQLMLLNITNITYYVMGTLIILRNVILWFLLIISPFLAVLFPFKFIRNIGWVWIGEFFRWLFYGPLLALFLGALATIWKLGIPFVFNFQPDIQGYIYPTATNILYGGPAQQLSALNSINNVESFAEYVITLIMLWAVILLPWWLMKIFRDYCCQDVNAMKNILLSIYDQLRMGPGGPSTPVAPLTPSFTGTAMKIPTEASVKINAQIGNIEDIKRAQTDQILRSINVHASNLRDVAALDANQSMRQGAVRSIEYLKDPMSAEGTNERQKYMGLRSELFQRAVKDDKIAKQVLSALSTTKTEQIQQRQTLLKGFPDRVTTEAALNDKRIAQDKIPSVHRVFLQNFITNEALLSELARESGVPEEQVKKTVQAIYKKEALAKSPEDAVADAKTESALDITQVQKVLKALLAKLKKDSALTSDVAATEQLPADVVTSVLEKPLLLAVEPEKNIEAAVFVPATIALEEYEEVKRMWKKQYEKGDVPLSSEITSRDVWIDHDIVFMTNVLNKLLSSEPSLKEQGLDELGYILPVFMINNFKADQILVYLKAKVEAAKLVKEEHELARDVKEAQKEDAFIDVKNATKLQEKTEELAGEMNSEKE